MAGPGLEVPAQLLHQHALNSMLRSYLSFLSLLTMFDNCLSHPRLGSKLKLQKHCIDLVHYSVTR